MTAPPWFLRQENSTNRQWKSLKRKELKEIRRAVNMYRPGSAYCPGYEDFIKLEKILSKLIDMHGVYKWGR